MAAPTPAFASISSLRSDLEAPPAPTLLADFEDRPPPAADPRDRFDTLPTETEAGGSSPRVSMSSTGSAHDISGAFETKPAVAEQSLESAGCW